MKVFVQLILASPAERRAFNRFATYPNFSLELLKPKIISILPLVVKKCDNTLFCYNQNVTLAQSFRQMLFSCKEAAEKNFFTFTCTH